MALFRIYLTDIHSKEIVQTKRQKEVNERIEIIDKRKPNTKSSAQTQTTPPKNKKSPTKQRSRRSPIYPPTTIKF